MDFGEPTELARFRSEFRAWLDVNRIEREPGEPAQRLLQRWHKQLACGRWVGVSWPEPYGGRDLSAAFESVVNEEIGRANAPDAPRIGYLGRAILAFGTDAQKNRYLRDILAGTTSWCQGFSEPNAGSDLAGLSTRAVADGADYVLDGQKVWTSYAEHSDLCLLLARTGTVESRHRGISAFVVPLGLPGIEVRPIKAITGDDEFCELFLSGVRVPAANMIGQPGDGWPIAMMTVAYERGAADVGYLSKFGARLRTAELQIRRDGAADDLVADRLGGVAVLYSVLKAHVRRRLRERELSDGLPGPEMSVDKLLMTTVDQELHDAMVTFAGAKFLVGGEQFDDLREGFFYSRAASVYGGTSQIQRNIISQQILGLPRA